MVVTEIKENLLYNDSGLGIKVYYKKNENGVFVRYELRPSFASSKVLGLKIPEDEKQRISLTTDTIDTITNQQLLGDQLIAQARRDGVKPSG